MSDIATPPTTTAPPPPTNSLGDEKSQLELQKLRLEIRNLKRSAWFQPPVAIPLIATLVTLLLSQYLGVFKAEQKMSEIANREALLAKADLTKSIDELSQQKKQLENDKLKLAGERQQIRDEVESLKTQMKDSYLRLFKTAIQEIRAGMQDCASGLTSDGRRDILQALAADVSKCAASEVRQSASLLLLRQADIDLIASATNKVLADVSQSRSSILSEAQREYKRLEVALSMSPLVRQDLEAKFAEQYRNLMEKASAPLSELRPS